MWVSNERKRKTQCVIEQEGEKRINDAVCGLHTASSNKRETERNGRRGMWVARHIVEEEGKKERMTRYMGCMPRCQTRGKKKERTTRHVGCTLRRRTRGEKKKLTTRHVGCTPCRRTRGKRKGIDDAACGLHTVSSN